MNFVLSKILGQSTGVIFVLRSHWITRMGIVFTSNPEGLIEQATDSRSFFISLGCIRNSSRVLDPASIPFRLHLNHISNCIATSYSSYSSSRTSGSSEHPQSEFFKANERYNFHLEFPCQAQEQEQESSGFLCVNQLLSANAPFLCLA